MRAGILVGLICLLSSAGCGDDSSTAGSTTASTPASTPSFEGIAWVVADGSVRPSATFKDGQVSGFGGCNRYNASYKSDGDSLTIGTIASTRMACQGPRDETERTYFAALAKVASRRIDDGRLVLLDDKGDELLRYVEASPRGRWTVTSLQTGDALQSPIKGTDLTADFKADGSLTGSGGCNSFSTSYTLDGDRMTIKPAASTRKACPEPEGVMEQESDYLAALESVTAYELAGDQLTLVRKDGTIAVALTR